MLALNFPHCCMVGVLPSNWYSQPILLSSNPYSDHRIHLVVVEPGLVSLNPYCCRRTCITVIELILLSTNSYRRLRTRIVGVEPVSPSSNSNCRCGNHISVIEPVLLSTHIAVVESRPDIGLIGGGMGWRSCRCSVRCRWVRVAVSGEEMGKTHWPVIMRAVGAV
jgi:hypothetical protein